MKHHHMSLSHSAPSSNDNTSSRQTGRLQQGAAGINPQVMFPPLHLQQPLLSRASDASHHFDPRTAPLLSSLQRSHVSNATPMHFQGPSSSFQQRRMSLLRDIGKAEERDRDMPPSGSSIIEGHGMVGGYPVTGSLRHVSNATSQVPAGVHHTFDRPITLIGNMPPHNYPHLHAPLHQGVSGHSGPHLGKNAGVRVVSNQPPAHSGTALPQAVGVQRQYNIPPGKSDPSSGFLEQKSKEDLVQAMDKVDRELSKVEAEISRLQKRKTLLEESEKKPPEPEKADSSPQSAEPKPRDLWQVIYAENKKKAESARAVLDSICPVYEMPLYNQPSDTKVYQENLKKNEEMRPKLLKFFQNRQKLQSIREKYLSARYDQLLEEWQKKVEETENNPKRKAKEGKTREFFEKLFPEVRKHREQQERVDRVGTRGDVCRSDADFADIVDGLSEQENQLQNLRQLAVVPPMLLDKEERRVTFIDNNGFIQEPFQEFKESQQLDSWADHEKLMFKEKYIQHPKNFNLIASFIEKKSVADCILYYYLTKKTNNYKALVRKQSMKPRKPKSGRAHHQGAQQNQDGSATNNVKESSEKTDKDDAKKQTEMENEDTKIEKPPSPRMTRARKQTMNWTEEEINLVKEGFGKHGRDFSNVSRMVPNKSEQQVRNFYHNYKKKHGLDQLITDSKKKKARSRHPTPAPSPEVNTDEDSNSRKSNESPSTESKNRNEKGKVEETGVSDEKQKYTDRTPSPAVTTSKSSVEAGDTAPQSTSHIRTRGRAAALATASAQDSASSETSGSKRASSEVSQTAAGEPTEKKIKKSERRTRHQKNSESAKDSKMETVKEEAPLVSKKPATSEKTDAVMETTTKDEGSESKLELKEQDKTEENKDTLEKAIVDAKKSEEIPMETKEEAPFSKKTIPQKNIISEEHDSSATCSADEETASLETTVATSVQNSTKQSVSPYGFNDDFNDSPARISLEKKRQPTTSCVTTTATVPPLVIDASRITTTAMNLTRKIPISSSSLTTTYNNDGRPQSLPPGSMVPSHPTITPSLTVPTSTLMIVPEMDMSRPSSTPVFGGFAVFTTKSAAPPYQQLTEHGQGHRASAPVPSSSKAAVISTAPRNVKSIGELTYNKGLSTVKKPAPAPMSVASVVDLTKESITAQHSAIPIPSSAQQDKKLEAPGLPVSKYQYHPTHPLAGSLQKDFQPMMRTPGVAATGVHHVALPPGYPRSYTEKDRQVMRERAAVIPEAPPIPVSSLRFPSSSIPSLNVPTQPYKMDPAKISAEQVQPPKAVDPKLQSQEPKQPATKESKPSPRIPLTSHSRMPPMSTGIPMAAHRLPYPDKISGIPAPDLKASSPDKVMQGHVIVPGSITQGRPVFRAQPPTAVDPQEVLEKHRFSPLVSGKGSIVQGIPASNLLSSAGSLPARSSPTRKISFPAEAHYGSFSNLPTVFQGTVSTVGMKLPGSAPARVIKVEKMSSQPTYSSNLYPNMPYLPPGAFPPGVAVKGKFMEDIIPSMYIPQSIQSNAPERKSSYIQPPTSVIGSELPPRHPLEKQIKDEITRPSSASRATPERRSVQDIPGLTSHHRSASSHLLHMPSKKGSVESKSVEDLRISQPSASLADQRFLAAAAAAAASQAKHPSTIFPDVQAILAQYAQHSQLAAAAGMPYGFLQPGFPGPLVRPFSPSSGNDSPESSRHNVLSQDFMTAQLMQQQSLAAAVHGSPLSMASPLSFQGPPLLVSTSTRHTASPASMERLNFIPQHATNSTPSQASPRGIPNITKAPTPQSPSSPHLLVKSHRPPSIPVPFSPGTISHAVSDRKLSSSPHMSVPHDGDRHPPLAYPGLALPADPHQASLLKQGITKTSLAGFDRASPTESNLLNPMRNNSPHVMRQSVSPHVMRQSISPHVPPPGSRPKVKQEVMFERSDLHRGVSPSDYTHRVYTRSPDRSAHGPPSLVHSDAVRSGYPFEGQLTPNRLLYEDVQRPSRIPSSGQTVRSHEPRSSSRDPADRQQDKTAKDLKTKGRATMTPAHLICTIIEQKISQYQEDETQDVAKQRSTDLLPGQMVERNPSDGKMKVSEQLDPKFSGIAQKAPIEKITSPLDVPSQGTPSAHTKTLIEHSHDIIKNIYKKEPSPKPVAPEMDGPMLLPADARNQDAVSSSLIRNARMLHPLAPNALIHGNQPLELIIRNALMTESSMVNPNPSMSRQPRPDSNSGRNSPAVRAAGLPFSQEKSSSMPYRSHPPPPDPKRTDPPHHFSAAASVPVSTAPQMYSALSFRQSSNTAQQRQLPAILSGRPVLPVGSSTPVGRPLSSSGPFHSQQAPPSSTLERPSMQPPQYESLSDSD